MTILQTIQNHLDLFQQTLFNQEWIKKKIISFSSDIKTRWVLCAIILYLNFKIYYNTPQRYSKKKKCLWFVPIRCNTKYLIVFSLILIIKFSFMYYLLKKNPFFEISEYRLRVLFIFITIGFLFILDNIYFNTTHTVKTNKDNFNPPLEVYPVRKRILLSLLILITLIYQFSIEYILGHTGESPEYKLNYILNRFQGFKDTTEDKIIFFSGWSKILEIIIHSILFMLNILYYPCKYNLPRSWNY